MNIYLAGSLSNWTLIELANELTTRGHDTFLDWLCPGPEADAFLLKYAKQRGWSYTQALKSAAAMHIFQFDKKHIDKSDVLVLVMPAGKSGHLELGYVIGQGKPGFVLFDKEPERFDVMYNFATGVFFDKVALVTALEQQ